MKRKYSKIGFFFILTLFFSWTLQAQDGQSLWTKTSFDKVSSMKQLYEKTKPLRVEYYQLNLQALTDILQNAPKREEGFLASNVIVSFPNVDGSMESFRIVEASTMTDELQNQFPDIRSYAGVSLINPAASIRFSVSPQKGLSSMVLSNQKTVFIEPYSEDLTTYSVFVRSLGDAPSTRFECQTESIDQPKLDIDLGTISKNANDGKLRTFRLALACTAEYSTYHGGTLADVTAAMNATMTRVNGVYERDLAVTMVMVPNSSIIFFDAATDGYTNNDGATMLNQNQAICDANIGTANYDIGHVFSTGGGGIAQLYSPCQTFSKAKGVTGQSDPVGDFFDIDYVAHEMGHQYGANHTQNNNCQRSSKSYEPGSASTIMGYAGICSPDVQLHSDDYFHGESIKEMWNNIYAGNSQCGTQSNTGNSAPVANAGSNYTIPHSTPFILKGAATDSNAGDVLTYCWEQMDATPATMPPVSTSTSGPLFRSLLPKTSPDRYMPDFETVLNGSIATTWEVVPTVGRTMNFRLTVRDNATGGASTDSDEMVVSTVSAAGPFAVTSQSSTGIIWSNGNIETITWNVAGTSGNGINTSNVNILLSTDGGQNFDTVLAANTPNDGSENITVPNIPAPYCRIMIEPVGNIYYAINSENFSIDYEVIETCYTYTNNTPLVIPDGAGANTPGTVVANFVDATDDITISDVNVTVNATHSYIEDLLVAINHPDDTQVYLWGRYCDGEDGFSIVFDDQALQALQDSGCTNPHTGTYQPYGVLADFNGKQSIGQWELLAVDYYNGDTGQIDDWTLEVCGVTETALSTDEFALQNFTIFPNPNNGSFTVRLHSQSSEDITINVFDIRGRAIFSKSFDSTTDFNQQINLTNVQSGMYMVKVSDGLRTTSQKIIVD